MIWALAAACLAASVPPALRWLRVAQREHYLAPAVTRFAWRWWTYGPLNLALMVLSIVAILLVEIDLRWGFLAVLAQVGPVGLSIKGRTSPLSWTERMQRLAVTTTVLFVAGVVGGAVTGQPLAIVLSLVLWPVLVDLSLLLLAPVEKSLGNRWVKQAGSKLEASGAQVVAITGSYGKTTTKAYLQHLISGARRSVASPASFNNRMGLARAINEQLVPGTEVFIAEMGTYGRGEIADLCRWIRPDVAAMVSIGPVHLERFRTEERIVEAKGEILDHATHGVIAVDHPLLRKLASERDGVIEITRVSSDGVPADVEYSRASGEIKVDGTPIGKVPPGVFGINLAVAVAIARALGVDSDGSRFESLPTVEHRQTVAVSSDGVSIIDDTFNSNPAGAAAGVEVLKQSGHGRKVVVTPGMVELGPRQSVANEEFGRLAAEVCDDLVIVGGTNRVALERGSANGRASVTVVANRDQAVDWVRNNLQPGDAVLYENDLPDHYP